MWDRKTCKGINALAMNHGACFRWSTILHAFSVAETKPVCFGSQTCKIFGSELCMDAECKPCEFFPKNRMESWIVQNLISFSGDHSSDWKYLCTCQLDIFQFQERDDMLLVQQLTSKTTSASSQTWHFAASCGTFLVWSTNLVVSLGLLMTSDLWAQ